MRSVLPRLLLSLAAFPCFGGTFTVSNPMDSGAGSLRDAITQLNASSDPSNTIDFDAMYAITLASDLPLITKPVTINGSNSIIGGSFLYRSLAFQPSPTSAIAVNSLIINNALSQGGAGGSGGINSGNPMLGGGGGGGGAGLGGALLFLSGSATINTVTLSVNHAKGGDGGAATMVNVVTGAGGGGLLSPGGIATMAGPAGSGGSGLDGTGGGAGSDCTGSDGAAGGFGGGCCSSSASAGAEGGIGGFGGGGGGTPQDTPGTGGFGGGDGGNFSAGSSALGGGGAGLGGAIFVHKDCTLTIKDGLVLSGNSVTGGSGANPGSALGSDLFMMSGSTVTFDISGNLSISTNIESDQEAGGGSGGGLVKTGLGTLTLGGTNTYSGTVFLNGGTLSVVSNDNLGDSNNGLNFNGGTLEATSDFTIPASRAFILTGPGTIDVSNHKTGHCQHRN